jgi:hypothetical protein
LGGCNPKSRFRLARRPPAMPIFVLLNDDFHLGVNP